MTRILLEQYRKTGEMEIKGNALLDTHGLHDWRISFENLRNAMYAPNEGDRGFWGQCDFENKVIGASLAGSGRPCFTRLRTPWSASRGRRRMDQEGSRDRLHRKRALSLQEGNRMTNS